MPETLKKLLAALGLQDTATEAEALSAVAALKTNIATLGAQIATPPDPARFVPVATLSALQAEHATVRGKLAALTAEIDAGKVAKVVEDGLAAGKLTPATADWARTLGAQNLASLTAYLDAAPVVMKPGETQSGGKKPAGGLAGLDTGNAKAIAEASLSYQTTQAAAGISVSTPAAVAHVINSKGV